MNIDDTSDQDALPPDSQLVATALTHWANHIQTGSISLAPSDIKAMQDPCGNVPVDLGPGVRIKALDEYQMRLVMRLRRLANDAANL